ncbi:hypothetical protein [Streptomyces sp. NBC_01304]|uniref:hypothetical protein n=1 Tax=Streptomyces sp. NBC_01304 TaxID=2903818 RepID=UPI002E0EDA9A|nr:hypothetical protein OG430_06535 [Streptomyces sp. NBC_01304]
MRSRTLTLFLAVTALTGLGVLNSPTATADADLTFVYGEPEISEQGHRLGWTWKLTNTGDRTARHVVLTHRLTPHLPVTRVSRECVVAGETIRCEYAGIAAGDEIEGRVDADVPRGIQESVRINGRVTYQPAPARTS